MSRLVLAFDLGGTNVRCGILNEQFEILARAKCAVGTRPAPSEAVKKMKQIAEEALGNIGKKSGEIACVGIGSPGPLNSQTGIIFETPNLGWKDVPLAKLVGDALGRPAFLENDAVSACWGEHVKGVGVDIQSMFIFTLGTGVGGGLILGGKVWKGPDDIAGHLGHMIVQPNGPTQVYDNPGSVEALCSATACIAAAQNAAYTYPESLLAKIPPGEITGAYVNACAEKGDEPACEIFRRIGYHLGIACASIANALNLELGVIGGGLSAAGDKILVPLRKELRRRALPPAGKRMRIELSKLGDDAGLVGAAGLALERLDGKQ
ncbi:MAG: ROK family protein [Planctomycetes bacterium]|nr:ROK family protein [Planctomycetota bacterium]